MLKSLVFLPIFLLFSEEITNFALENEQKVK